MQKIRPDMDIGKNIQTIRYANKLTQDQVIAKLNLMGISMSKSTYAFEAFPDFLRKKDRHLHDVCLRGIYHPFFLILLFDDLFQLFPHFLIRYLSTKLLKPFIM